MGAVRAAEGQNFRPRWGFPAHLQHLGQGKADWLEKVYWPAAAVPVVLGGGRHGLLVVGGKWAQDVRYRRGLVQRSGRFSRARCACCSFFGSFFSSFGSVRLLLAWF